MFSGPRHYDTCHVPESLGLWVDRFQQLTFSHQMFRFQLRRNKSPRCSPSLPDLAMQVQWALATRHQVNFGRHRMKESTGQSESKGSSNSCTLRI